MASVFPRDPDAPLLRPAGLGDAATVAALLEDLGYPGSPAEARTRIGQLLDHPGHELLLLEHGGRPCGLLCLDFIYSLPLGRTSCRISALVIADEARGRGLGRWLVGEAERRARLAGASRIEVSSAGHRHDAHKLYRECGFQDGSVRLVKRFGDA